MFPTGSKTDMGSSRKSKIVAFREKMERRWESMQRRRNTSTVKGSTDQKCHLFDLPPELLGMVIDQIGSYMDLHPASRLDDACSSGCLPKDTVDRQRDFLSFVRSHRVGQVDTHLFPGRALMNRVYLA